MSAEFFIPAAKYKPDAIARRIGVHRNTVYNWIESGKLNAIDKRHPGTQRPRYTVYGHTLNAFLARRRWK